MVALTRALLLDPSILLLDEPTSAMDNGAEQQIMRRLLEIVPGKTVILVTHRSALLPLVDRLIVLERGKVVMDGARDAVLKRLSGIEK
jgi:ATP-binding cassette subfamily C protein LapB